MRIKFNFKSQHTKKEKYCDKFGLDFDAGIIVKIKTATMGYEVKEALFEALLSNLIRGAMYIDELYDHKQRISKLRNFNILQAIIIGVLLLLLLG